MAIPPFRLDGILPPFVGTDPVNRNQASPFPASMTEFVMRFGTSAERKDVLRGLLSYRAALSLVGINNGFQWIDGSFVEDCEMIRQRAPGDVDVVTYAYRPTGVAAQSDWMSFFMANSSLFDPPQTKANFKCDAYYIDLHKPPHISVSDAAYFDGLFSHQRDTGIRKGMVVVPLQSDDTAAQGLL